MPDHPVFLSERLLQEGEKSVIFFQSLTPKQYNQIIYTEGKGWSARQVLAHFVSAEQSLCWLVENIAQGGDGSSENFDIDSYNELKVKELENETLESLIEQFQQNRLRTTRVVANLKIADLQRQGRHPFLGIAPLSEIIKIIYRHNQIHQRDIRQGLSKE